VGDSGQYGIGDLIGHYRIVAELGRGGMGVVFKAHEESLERHVAIKVLGQHLAEDASYVERFVREARSAARLNHPNIVQIHAIGEDQGRHYFVMEYVDGSSLHEVLRRSGPRGAHAAAGLVLQTAAGLAAAHDQDVIHRDIKPANILIDDRGLVKIADFGLALMHSSASRLTATGMFMGTPGYLAPEQCLDQEVGPGTDIYSLGVSYFEMLTGQMPFKAESPFALIRKIVEVEPPDVRELRPEIDDETRKVLARMMAKDPGDRYESCHELIGDLQQVLEVNVPEAGADADPGVAAAALTPPPTRRIPSGRAASEVDDSSPTIEVDSGSGATSPTPPSGGIPPPLPVAQASTWPAPTPEPGGVGGSRRPLLVAAAGGLAVVLLVGGGTVLWTMKAGRDDTSAQTLAVEPTRARADPVAPVGFPVGGRAVPPVVEGAVESAAGAEDVGVLRPAVEGVALGGGEVGEAGANLTPSEPARPGEADGLPVGPSRADAAPTPSTAVPTATARPTPISARNAEIGRLVEQLRSRDSATRRNAARAVYRSHPREARLLQVVNEELLRGFERNLEDSQHVDAMAWMCNVLGVCGQTRYRSTLEKVSNEASNRKIKKYAEKNLERLR